jgi:Holliday junction resolvasome RuvABC DNA-binding subunit
MIAHLNGKLIEKNPTDLSLNVLGVGYEVKISLILFQQLVLTSQLNYSQIDCS